MASRGGKRAFDPHSLYDVSADEMRRIQARRELRDNLKKEFEFKRSNPFKPMGEHLFDPALQRFLSMKVFHYEMFKPTPKTAALGFAMFVVPVAALYGIITWERKRYLGRIERGEIAYKDRFYKYV